MTITELIRKRVLLKLGTSATWSRHCGEVSEYFVVEVSPSGNWVKLRTIYGNQFWRPVTECSLVEVLTDLKPEPPPKA